jgi:VIT1/CCC1 family predicted Fe2+/Mn2+ transporter
MAAGNALRARADADVVAAARASEEQHTDLVPEGEREEVRQIFAAKGFEGRALEQAVAVVTRDRGRWVDTMLREELGLRLTPPSPTRTALITFASFVGVGSVPLLALLLARATLGGATALAVSTMATAAAFVAVGWVKGVVLGRSRLRSSVETLGLGGVAAALAWLLGKAAAGLAGA